MNLDVLHARDRVSHLSHDGDLRILNTILNVLNVRYTLHAIIFSRESFQLAGLRVWVLVNVLTNLL